MSDAIGTSADRSRNVPAVPRGVEVVHEAYSFACMRCGHAWEQEYDVEHHIDASGEPKVFYRVAGKVVLSPLTRPTCENCGGHNIRIMRSGRVAQALSSWARAVRQEEEHEAQSREGRQSGAEQAGAEQAGAERAGEGRRRRFHLPGFHHRDKPHDAA